jgi:predicted nucleic acid-binding Zn ribbon protein
VHDGQLIVVTDDPAWASQLRWLASELVARIAEGDGPRLTGILVRVRPR